MKIDWSNWGQAIPKKVSKVRKFLRFVFGTHLVPLHCSNHYRRESFHDDGVPRLF